jgi:LemA protein
MLTWIIVAIAVASALYVAVLFNRLVRTRQMAREAWSGIDVQLKRRSDLIPNVVDVVKTYAAHERDVLTAVTELRGAGRALPPGAVDKRGEVEGALSAALGRLMRWRKPIPTSRRAAISSTCSNSSVRSNPICRWPAVITTAPCAT